MVSETRLFDTNTQTVNALTANRLEIDCLGVAATIQGDGDPAAATCFAGILVNKRTSGGVETNIVGSSATPAAQASTTSVGVFVLVNGTVAIPGTALNTTDSITAQIFLRTDVTAVWTLGATFTTGQLGDTQLDAVTWTLTYRIALIDDGTGTFFATCSLQAAPVANDTRVANFSHSTPAVSGSGTISDAASTILSQAPQGSGAIIDAASTILSQAPIGSGAISDAVSTIVSETPTGSGSIADSASTMLSQAPQGSGTVNDAVSTIISETPAGSGAVNDAISTIISEKPTGSGTISDSASATPVVLVSGSGTISDAVSTILSQAPIGSGAIGDAVSTILSQAPQGSGAINEAVSTIVSETPTGSGSIADSASTMLSQAPQGSGIISDSASTIFSGKPVGTGAFGVSVSLTVTSPVTMTRSDSYQVCRVVTVFPLPTWWDESA